MFRSTRLAVLAGLGLLALGSTARAEIDPLTRQPLVQYVDPAKAQAVRFTNLLHAAGLLDSAIGLDESDLLEQLSASFAATERDSALGRLAAHGVPDRPDDVPLPRAVRKRPTSV